MNSEVLSIGSPGTPDEREAYRVQLPLFEGPLDLLLHLIESERLDISSISLAQITDQYLSYVRSMNFVGAADLADFLVMAARLVWIKSLLLLPAAKPAADADEVDPGEELARQLREYKRFKESALWLRAVEESGRHSYVRAPAIPEVERRLEENSITLMDLWMAAQTAFSPTDDAVPAPQALLVPHVVTVRHQMQVIRDMLTSGMPLAFRTLVRSAGSRLEVIVTLMAVLELIKRDLVTVEQKGIFGDITITGRQALEVSEPEGLPG